MVHRSFSHISTTCVRTCKVSEYDHTVSSTIKLNFAGKGPSSSGSVHFKYSLSKYKLKPTRAHPTLTGKHRAQPNPSKAFSLASQTSWSAHDQHHYGVRGRNAPITVGLTVSRSRQRRWWQDADSKSNFSSRVSFDITSTDAFNDAFAFRQRATSNNNNNFCSNTNTTQWIF